jgi:hypothetical protein
VDYFGDTLIGGILPALYCDNIFTVLACVIPRFINPSTQVKLVNLQMASLHQVNTHVKADHRKLFDLFELPE